MEFFGGWGQDIFTGSKFCGGHNTPNPLSNYADTKTLHIIHSYTCSHTSVNSNKRATLAVSQ